MLYTIVDPCQIFQVQTMKLEAGVEVLVEASETQPALAIPLSLWKVTPTEYRFEFHILHQHWRICMLSLMNPYQIPT